MSGDSLQPARYRAQHLSRDPRRLESENEEERKQQKRDGGVQ
ncbi:hypothetical protein SNOG_06708 [Parastagonospora nodorum SN15]|uniref:Uncharacterized protein n=1 Tax=Phaeosphaeria nodorum (strain SN15 / ATCC MYA-4574 / FGSC 10173) TaxID=321614 RepID=Q0UNF6_PHANO|nr:hypothetical protein SNOG_06708 [Parastagonospora nodorum SN15]EAT85359.1 hypothetical protein SNOG_06708 [Parastagonospora nodorum SN15]